MFTIAAATAAAASPSGAGGTRQQPPPQPPQQPQQPKPPHPSQPPAPESAGPLTGRRVRLSGLQRRPEYNGRAGAAAMLSPVDGRYDVLLEAVAASSTSGGGGGGGGDAVGLGPLPPRKPDGGGLRVKLNQCSSDPMSGRVDVGYTAGRPAGDRDRSRAGILIYISTYVYLYIPRVQIYYTARVYTCDVYIDQHSLRLSYN